MPVLQDNELRTSQGSSPEPAISQDDSDLDDYVPHGHPPGFWDSLSKIYLTLASLKEFDRRVDKETGQPPCYNVAPDVEYPNGQTLQRLKRFARRGGPDLSHLRGFANSPDQVDDTMAGTLQKATRDKNFGQKLIDNGIYPPLYKHTDERLQPEPVNLTDIQARLIQRRPSLTSSQFPVERFKEFQREQTEVTTEAKAMNRIIPVITGKEGGSHLTEMNHPFNNLVPFDKDLSFAQPDLYYGAQPSAVNQRVRSDLGGYIIPSTNAQRPVAPNFFLEVKGEDGKAAAARAQVLYYGAQGARAMFELQNYGAAEPVYDNNAYSFSTTYHAGTGTLGIYAVHPTQPSDPGGKPEYHMTQVHSFAMDGSVETFRAGATAYRNARDLAKIYRDRFIKQANQVADQVRESEPTTVSKHGSPPDRSNAFKDEQADDEAKPGKRPRCSPVQHTNNQQSATKHHPTRSSTLRNHQSQASTRRRQRQRGLTPR